MPRSTSAEIPPEACAVATSPAGTAYRGRHGCAVHRAPGALPGLCHGWHCAYCHAPASSQGQCSARCQVDRVAETAVMDADEGGALLRVTLDSGEVLEALADWGTARRLADLVLGEPSLEPPDQARGHQLHDAIRDMAEVSGILPAMREADARRRQHG